MFVYFLFFHICLFSHQAQLVLSGLQFPPQPQSLGVPRASSWCNEPAAYLCPLTLLLLTSFMALAQVSVLTEAAFPDRSPWFPAGLP